ncbi:MAG: glycogen/starch synthase [Brumimicrobium sp.]|nr:glycogen/starch synthase [Brumimicrobium sp.]MCO5269804.1 glycogen/starch synthase [Brumimicrobium sp.]
MEKKKVLFVSQEIYPFLPTSEISTATRKLTQGTQDNGKEIRVFTPRFGLINERRHQLHEVIRLSGMNLIVDDTDHPLIIKVASIPTARIQVYFIDNDEFFRRKGMYANEKGEEFKDNDERSMFFCRGVLEIVKKLGWKPDVIHCHGWMTALMPMYIKDVYKNDPHFDDVKVVYSLYEDGFNKNWDDTFESKLKFEGFNEEIISTLKSGDFFDLNRAAIEYSDGVIIGNPEVNGQLRKIFNETDKLKLDFESEEGHPKKVNEFFDRVLDEEAVIQ